MTETINELRNRPYFFDNGLKFECQNCGSCCNGAPGSIYVTSEEIEMISDFLELDKEIVIERCLYPYRDSFSIRECEDGRCLFYEAGCAIYHVRPVQCRTYPFWISILRSEKTWNDASKKCPGIGKGRFYSKEEIFKGIEASLKFIDIS